MSCGKNGEAAMIHFLMGIAVGAAVRSDKRLVGRALARLAVKAEAAASYASHRVHQLSAQFAEDYEDAVAEDCAERAARRDQSGFSTS
jgi:hypothetical protein